MDITPILKDLEEKAKLKIPLEEGDYLGENGLMFCGKCKSAKETVVNILGEETKVRCLCECGKLAYKKECLERDILYILLLLLFVWCFRLCLRLNNLQCLRKEQLKIMCC